MTAIFNTSAVMGVLLLAGVSAATAADDTILTVDITDEAGAVVGSHSFSLAELREMQTATFGTETIWTEGMQTFTGVPLSSLVAQFAVTGPVIEAVAINAYSVQIPTSDAVADGPMIAFERNGAAMSVRNKGPLWVVYPYDSNPDYQTEVVYSRSIWQLEKLIVSAE
ncbi:molybdopterin-dependent oxidoreductase [Epibacterium sp. SM1969]|uniref:Molybdopterin-dependent oxidoreductase n=1 Tax=Tritonibacter aquimaris TaxID=2663379 RepID=A0A844AJQ7_9RHOB|nr:molybdopterin-dependent oxidoreductase [Tritonibacter aquimaris]MQY41265.1 molybdopterin-dependent oxidoreductase [Tritonibacter aquimaris]